jgi:CMP-N-acetylneuraminic acid synthetase
MKYLAVIPARGGSQRLPNKNILTLNNKPLLQWTIDFAMSLENIEDVVLSTDSQTIIDSIEPKGILLPWLRPSYLSTDNSLTSDVCLHALEWYEKTLGRVDAVITLQPTSPFRSLETFEKARGLFELHETKTVLTVIGQSFKRDSLWCRDSDVLKRLTDIPRLWSDQLLNEELVYPSGNLYITNANYLKQHKSLLSPTMISLRSINRYEDIDIDEAADFELANLVAKYLIE